MPLMPRARLVSASMLTSVVLVVAGCAKESKGTKFANTRATVKPITGNVAGDSDAALSPGESNVDRLREEWRKDDDILRGLIDAEANERKAADQKFSEDLIRLAARLDDVYKGLELRVKALEVDVENLKPRVAALEAQMKPLQDQVNAHQSRLNEIDAKLAKLTTDAQTNAQSIAALQTEKEALAETLAAARADLESVTLEFQAHKEQVAKTYATKNALEEVAKTATAAANSADALHAKIDVSKIPEGVRVDLQKLRTDVDEIRQDADRLRTDVDRNTSDIAALNQRLSAHIVAYQVKSKELAESVRLQILNVRAEMLIVGAGLGEKLLEMQARVQALSAYSVETRRTLSEGLSELKSKQAETGMKVADLEKDFLAKVAADQAQQAALANALKDLSKEVERARDVADEALALSKDNASRISALKGELEASITGLSTRITGVERNFKAEIDALRKEMDTKIDAVRTKAGELAAELGEDVQKQFVQITTLVGELQNRLEATRKDVVRVFAVVLKDGARIAELESSHASLNEETSQALIAFLRQLGALEKAFVEALDPVGGATGVNVQQLNLSFKVVQDACKDAGAIGPFNAVFGREYFFHLARSYTQVVMYGARTGDADLDKLFLGQAPMLSVKSLGSTLAADAVGTHAPGAAPGAAQGAGQNCMTALDAWARRILVTNDALSVQVRKALSDNRGLRLAVEALKTRVDALNAKSSQYEALLAALLKKVVGTDALVRQWMEDGKDGVRALRIQIALILQDQARVALELEDQKLARARIEEILRELAKQKDLINKNAAATAALEGKVAELNTRIAALAKATQAEIDKLTGAQKTAFNLIAALAGRLGYGDLVQAAKAATTALGGTINTELQRLPAMCMGVQHYYNHATNRDLPVTRCESLMSTPGRLLDANELTRCAVHGSWNWGGASFYAKTWGNMSLVPNGWSAMNTASGGGHIVNDGLTFAAYDVNNPGHRMPLLNLRDRKPGSAYPSDGASTLVLRVVGRASKFKITVRNGAWNPPNAYGPNANNGHYAEVNAADWQVSGGMGSNSLVYEIPVPLAIGVLGNCRWDREIVIQPIDNLGGAGQNTCVHRFHQFSPLVFDFSRPAGPASSARVNGTDGAQGMIETVNPLLSRARFDLDGNGQPEATGWIKGDVHALLALDLDGSGRIEDGRELFGEATRLADGTRARDGYRALAQHDADGDGFITARDPVFSRLRLWFDVTGDGASQSYELKSLAQAGVTRIALSYGRVAPEDERQDHGLPEANLVKYRARFWGPQQCGTSGCNSYDVFFGSTEAVRFSKNETR